MNSGLVEPAIFIAALMVTATLCISFIIWIVSRLE